MNKNINNRIEYLRDVLIAMINEYTGNGIPEEELKEHSDEVLCAEAALAFRVIQIAMIAGASVRIQTKTILTRRAFV